MMLALLLLAAQALADDAADARYASALEAWRGGDPATALAEAAAATTLDEDHRPARLLAGYALTRTGAGDAALAVFASLAEAPVDDATDARVRVLAARALHRLDDASHRDQWSLGLAFGGGPERGGPTWHVAGGYAVQLGAPLGGAWRLRIDAAHRWLTEAEDAGGWRLTPMLEVSRATGHGGLDLALGPTFWVAEGVWWPSNAHLYGGLRLAAGADERLGRRFGVRLEVGVIPVVLDDTLWWYRAPADVRLALVAWLGHPRTGPLRP